MEGDPQNTSVFLPCPTVPLTPDGVKLDDLIGTAAEHYQAALRMSIYDDSGLGVVGQIAGHARWFYDQVKAGGDWDFKLRDKESINRGLRSKFEAFGNFAYGAMGRAAGFSPDQLFRLAGHYQTDPRGTGGIPSGIFNSLLGRGGKAPYGDEWTDFANITQGIKYYRMKFIDKTCR